MRLQMINVQEFAWRLSTLGADTLTSDDVVDLGTAAGRTPARGHPINHHVADTNRVRRP
jgi:hypothetical protein